MVMFSNVFSLLQNDRNVIFVAFLFIKIILKGSFFLRLSDSYTALLRIRHINWKAILKERINSAQVRTVALYVGFEQIL